MKNRLKAAMKSSISEILETMFFVSLEFDESGNFDDFIQSANGNLSASRLRFGGDLSGSFFFYAPESVLLTITENFLAQDRYSITKNHVEGTLKEITNMIAGSTLSSFDKQALFNLNIPEVIDTNRKFESFDEAGNEQIFFMINSLEGRLAAKLTFSI
ncbi:MAG TPA: chemotaxis protein CheX [Desulfobacterales bacterium]|mgnify:CR=1 FL=1|nr:chemotaxis protein CheX [Desulfobacterales bacterium]